MMHTSQQSERSFSIQLQEHLWGRSLKIGNKTWLPVCYGPLQKYWLGLRVLCRPGKVSFVLGDNVLLKKEVALCKPLPWSWKHIWSKILLCPVAARLPLISTHGLSSYRSTASDQIWTKVCELSRWHRVTWPMSGSVLLLYFPCFLWITAQMFTMKWSFSEDWLFQHQ